MTDEKITQKALDSLPEYSLSDPTGTIVGKVWKRNLGLQDPPNWIICEYVKHPDPKLVGIEYRKPVIVEAK